MNGVLMKNTKLGIATLILVTLLWSNGFFATQIALDAGLEVDAILSLRFLAAAILLGALKHKNIKTISAATWKRGLFCGIVLFIAFYAQTLGQSSTEISIVALITSSYVLFVPFLLWIMKKRRPSLTVYLSTIVTLIGLLILNYQGGMLRLSLGAILVLLSALAFALHVSFTGAYCDADPSLDITFIQLLTAGVLSFAAMWIRDAKPDIVQLQLGIWGILYLIVFSTAICYFLQIFGQKHVRAEQASIIMALEGVFASALSIFLGYENFQTNVLFGGTLVVLGAILVNTERVIVSNN